VEILREALAAFDRGDWDTSLESFHPEVVWHTREDAPDAGVYRGLEGVEKLMEFWLEVREFRGKSEGLEAVRLMEQDAHADSRP
jgi:ketosteroid isomerase-like protein